MKTRQMLVQVCKTTTNAADLLKLSFSLDRQNRRAINTAKAKGLSFFYPRLRSSF